MKLAILLTSGLESEDGRTAHKLAEAALGLGHQVDIFFMDDGVYQLPGFEDLLGKGMKGTVCAHNAYQRGLGKREEFLIGGQNDWAEIVSAADRVVVFG